MINFAGPLPFQGQLYPIRHKSKIYPRGDGSEPPVLYPMGQGMADGEGVEPSRPLSGLGGFQDRCLRRWACPSVEKDGGGRGSRTPKAVTLARSRGGCRLQFRLAPPLARPGRLELPRPDLGDRGPSYWATGAHKKAGVLGLIPDGVINPRCVRGPRRNLAPPARVELAASRSVAARSSN